MEALYRAEFRAVYAFLWRLGARDADMEDLAHDVFVTAARRLPSFEVGRPVRPWLFGIAFRVYSDARRKVRPVEEVSEALEDGGPGPEVSAERAQAQRLLRRALETLPEVQRTAVVLHDLEGLSAKEVSEMMECPAPTTYARLKAGREALGAAVRRLQLLVESGGGAR